MQARALQSIGVNWKILNLWKKEAFPFLSLPKRHREDRGAHFRLKRAQNKESHVCKQQTPPLISRHIAYDPLACRSLTAPSHKIIIPTFWLFIDASPPFPRPPPLQIVGLNSKTHKHPTLPYTRAAPPAQISTRSFHFTHIPLCLSNLKIKILPPLSSSSLSTETQTLLLLLLLLITRWSVIAWLFWWGWWCCFAVSLKLQLDSHFPPSWYTVSPTRLNLYRFRARAMRVVICGRNGTVSSTFNCY